MINQISRTLLHINIIMENHNIVPDVVPVAPRDVAKVTFPSGATIDIGNELTPTQVQDAPTVEWNADPAAFYTLCKTDPDEPSRNAPKVGEWHHWLVGNIPGNDVSKGEVLSAYIGAGPSEGSGLHRYVFLIYKQNGKIDFDEPRLGSTSCDRRGKFSIAKFAEKYNLGNPVAGNFYRAQWDSYVPTLFKRLGF